MCCSAQETSFIIINNCCLIFLCRGRRPLTMIKDQKATREDVTTDLGAPELGYLTIQEFTNGGINGTVNTVVKSP